MQKLRNTFFYLDIFVKENKWSDFYNYHSGAKSGFKFERNKDLTFILIIIDID